jgi:2-methyl-3-hydroxypyridine 5-carboxylic acid dioxygenase
MFEMKQMHVEIAGGGFAGLVAATAFAQRGWSVRVHEAAPSLRSFGAGIYLAPNGQRVLQTIGAYDQVMSRSYSAPWKESRDQDNHLLAREQNEIPGGGRLVTLTRRDLHRAIETVAREAGVSIVTNSRAIAADPKGVLWTEDGRQWPADLVIAADGVGSNVRDSLDGVRVDASQFSFVVHRFLVPRRWAGPAEDQWLNYVNYWNCDLERRVLYTPCNEHDLYLLLGAQETDELAHQDPLSSKVWSESFPVLANAFRELPERSRLDHYEVLRVDSWSCGRVAIVGDAAHAMPPTIGQGAGTAMMNALGLAAAMEGTEDVETSLREWEEAEREVTEVAQNASVEIAANLFSGIVERGAGWDESEVKVAQRVPRGVINRLT